MKKFLPIRLTLLAQGFTLVELLIVITIIGILAAIGFVAFGGTGGKARDAKRKGDIDQISKAYEVNYDGNGYIALADTHFTSGKTPTPPSTGDYTCVTGPGGTLACTTNSTATFTVCANLEGGSNCTAPSATCYCRSAAQGSLAAAPAPPPAPVAVACAAFNNTTSQTCDTATTASACTISPFAFPIYIKCTELTAALVAGVSTANCGGVAGQVLTNNLNYYTADTAGVAATGQIRLFTSATGCAVPNAQGIVNIRATN